MSETKKLVDLSKLPERILSILVAHSDPVTQKTFEEELPDITLTQLLPVLNRMQKEGQVEVLVNSNRTLSWRMREIGNIDKLKSLTDVEESLVYNCIRKNGNEGATVKAISIDTKLPQNRLPRILKSLIGRKLVKELPVLAGSKQKIFLLYELEPSESLAANTLFAGETGVDGEFVAMLRTACLKYIQDKTESVSKISDPLKRWNSSYASVEEFHRFITDAKLCTVPLVPSDVKTVLDALVYGGELEMKQSTTVDTSAVDEKGESKPTTTRSFLYRLAPRTPGFAFLAHIPCTIALNKRRSRTGGVICPPDCPIFSAFLDSGTSTGPNVNTKD
ncbi:DNA-directed RNA polymerase III subunit RPC6 [Echinococcus granulosus]|uniref:DNA-directed RNA polymerase III subunit RPC6 n=1 Tax=Echinococcus granulosus TaxID=6210 RepID=U6JE15_ECHGR|nr:DNA-directed RNA polymerase III subunit RPC6 [Echinococcus granulosus]EUB62074.1 DNA-directed RNA polymerase III subunit RPC6 [Echinococcus granulosus]KAH9285159.1 DNA-directed RNA polymerase III subunit RPC6 [Echinococcus granulosus]CDS19964.1 DNA directed RNA polymerase III subunit RPC6 [Echinococcus granulosus]